MLTRTLIISALLLNATHVSANNSHIALGGFYSHSDSSMDVTDPVQGNTIALDFEKDLNLQEEQFLPFVAFRYQFGDRHHLFADWKQLHRNANNNALSQPFQVQIDDVVYDVQAGTELATELNIDIARVGYGYDLLHGPQYTVGVSAGLHIMSIETQFKGAIGVCNVNTVANGVCNSQPIPSIVDENVTAPLPNIGIYGDYQLANRWHLSAHAEYFQIKLDDVEGRLIDIRVGMEAQICPNWSMSAAFNYYRVDVEIDQKNNYASIADYNLDYRFIGPMISLSYKF